MSEFRMQIIHAETGKVVEWMPGREIEGELIESLCAKVRLKGVGLGRTTDHVVNDVRTAFQELLYELKSRV